MQTAPSLLCSRLTLRLRGIPVDAPRRHPRFLRESAATFLPSLGCRVPRSFQRGAGLFQRDGKSGIRMTLSCPKNFVDLGRGGDWHLGLRTTAESAVTFYPDVQIIVVRSGTYNELRFLYRAIKRSANAFKLLFTKRASRDLQVLFRLSFSRSHTISVTITWCLPKRPPEQARIMGHQRAAADNGAVHLYSRTTSGRSGTAFSVFLPVCPQQTRNPRSRERQLFPSHCEQ